MSNSNRWYAVKFQPHKYQLAKNNLERQGYIVFCPMISRLVRHARKSTLKPTPLFPSYLFVKFDIENDRWHPIDSTPGVVSVVKSGNSPQPLPNGLVENLQSSTSTSGLVNRIGPKAAIGDNVRVVGGAFDDWLGRVVALPAKDRITLLLDAATRKIELTLRAGQVTQIPDASLSKRSIPIDQQSGALA